MPTAPDTDVAGADSTDRNDARSSSAFQADGGIEPPPLRAILDQMPVGVMIAQAPTGKVTYANRQAAAIFGGPVTPTETTDQLERTFEAWHPDGSRLHASEFPLARGLAGETVQGQEVHFRKPDGTLGVVRASASPIRDAAGNIVGGITTYYDVSAEKQFEERLREESRINETLYRLGASFAEELDEQKLVQLITDEATSLTGAKFGSFFFNEVDERGERYMLYTLSGVPREAFAGFPMPRNTAIFAPTFGGEAVLRLDDVTNDPRYGKSPPHYGQPPGHLPVRSYLAVPDVARSGEVLGGLFFGHPEKGRFAEQHERIVVGAAAQAAVALENARLYRGLKESEERAQRAYEKAYEADRRKDEFLAMLGHELRNPLAP
ncbi:MAG: GAF domain-containing protein, partial [Myxococcales bacterium]